MNSLNYTVEDVAEACGGVINGERDLFRWMRGQDMDEPGVVVAGEAAMRWYDDVQDDIQRDDPVGGGLGGKGGGGGSSSSSSGGSNSSSSNSDTSTHLGSSAADSLSGNGLGEGGEGGEVVSRVHVLALVDALGCNRQQVANASGITDMIGSHLHSMNSWLSGKGPLDRKSVLLAGEALMKWYHKEREGRIDTMGKDGRMAGGGGEDGGGGDVDGGSEGSGRYVYLPRETEKTAEDNGR
jgi:hypothetical protein